MAGELANREPGDVYVAFTDDPGRGPRLRITAADSRVLVPLTLLALVDAGESPWAEVREAEQPAGGDPYGYRGALLCINEPGRTVAYRVGGYLPRERGYVAERQPGAAPARITSGESRATVRRSARTDAPPAGLPAKPSG